MLVIGTFEHRVELEQALSLLEYAGIPRESILAVPMAVSPGETFQYAGETSDLAAKAFEIGMACATGASVVGISAGFVLDGGPIIWGVLSAAAGFAAGQAVYRRRSAVAGKRSPSRPGTLPEVTVVVRCSREECRRVAELMWKHHALTVGETDDTAGAGTGDMSGHKPASSGT
ncbi:MULTISPECIES: hypothetical protein [Paenibacillus]|uniref:hypothetical protein n=1 Tax=Paenibacillus TaxID=44249 RepID=UPI0022B8FCCA|nr:hypothetical protein [Paenibacillus caseinilyticus]MCZ8522267.1 hypothetical protein [Paenibacillus caseinilyticus]